MVELVQCAFSDRFTYTVKPVYNGHCISRSPLYNSQVTESQMGLQCAFQPVLTGHLSITASFFLGPKGDHYRQVCTHVRSIVLPLTAMPISTAVPLYKLLA